MNSSYKNNINFGDLIETITYLKNPKKIVEFGILDGYSLEKFVNKASDKCIIEAYDIFDEFNGNHANEEEVNNKFSNNKNVMIKKADFYKSLNLFENNSIDILHIDIANNGDTYQFVFDNYINKIKKNGIIIIEGGSIERDNIYWMNKYNKKKINPILEKYKNKYNILIINKFPSITLIKYR